METPKESSKKKGLLAKLSAPADVVTLPINRLAIISDFIFASAMTMMVLFLDFPDPDIVATGDDISEYYLTKGSGSGVFNFLITFLIVAVYWFKHLERFQCYKGTDQNHLYIEIIFLALLVLVPIANSLSVIYPNVIHIQAFYSLVMFGLGMAAYFGWLYATHKHRLVDKKLNLDSIISVRHETLVEPVVALLALLMAFIYPALWDITLMLIPVFFILQKILTKRKLNALKSYEDDNE